MPANDYNLNIPRYIDSSEREDLHDLDAHLRGGIPNRDIDVLSVYWQVFPSLRAELFEPGDRPGYCRAKLESQKVKPKILEHPEFKTYGDSVEAIFDKWKITHQPLLKGLHQGSAPKEVVERLSESLLDRFSDLPLLSKYDAYQQLVEYWDEVMQDDIYLISADGWVDAAKPRATIDDKDKKIKETPDLTIQKKKYKMDLIPPVLIVARYFVAEQGSVDTLQEKREVIAGELEEFIEEHTGEEGILEDLTNDKGKVPKAGVAERLKAIKNDPDSADDRADLLRCLELIEAESEANKAVKDAQAALDAKVLARYAKLSETEIKALVVDDKWFGSIGAALDGEVERLTQALAGRVKQLEERYAATLPELEHNVNALTGKVEAHLKQMGVSW